MSDTPEYILKQPIEGTFRSPEYYGKEVYEVVLKTETLMHRFQPVAKDVFEAMYQLVDIPAIEKQLDEIIWRNAFTTFIDSDSDEQQAEIDKAVGDILGLFGLENKESN